MYNRLGAADDVTMRDQVETEQKGCGATQCDHEAGVWLAHQGVDSLDHFLTRTRQSSPMKGVLEE